MDPAGGSLPSWRLLQLPDVLAQHVLSFLPENTIPYAVRLTCKDAAASFNSLQQKTFYVGPKHPPIPAGALLARWGPPRSTSSLTRSQRYTLLYAAARAGDIPTMQQLLTTTGCVLNLDIISKAAESRQPALAAWLLQHEDCPITRRTRPHELKEATVDLMKAAVSSGSVDTCKVMHRELLKLTGAGFDPAKHEGMAVAAARSGSPAVCTWLRRKGTFFGLSYDPDIHPSSSMDSNNADSSSRSCTGPASGGGVGGGAEAVQQNSGGGGGAAASAIPAEEQLSKGVCKWEWALEQISVDRARVNLDSFLPDAAHDCDLAALQRVYDKYVRGSRWHPDTGSTSGGGGRGGGGRWAGAGREEDGEDDSTGDDDDPVNWSDLEARAEVLVAALCSPTSDWEAKARWLLAKGYPRKLFCGSGMLAECSCAVERMEWMAANRVTLYEDEEQELAHSAAACGHVPLLKYLLDKGVMGRAGGKAGESDESGSFSEGGDGSSSDGSSDSGSWRTDVAGGKGGDGEDGGWDGYEEESDWDEEEDRIREVFIDAAERGHIEVLKLLVGRGYELRPSILSIGAAGSGNVELVEWCLQRLCCGGEGGGGNSSGDGDASGVGAAASGEAAGAGGSALGASGSSGADGQQQQQQQQRQDEADQRRRERRLLSPAVMAEAARSGSTALVQWLHARGCAWDGAALGAAAIHGSQELVEWMAAQGCPMPVSIDICAQRTLLCKHMSHWLGTTVLNGTDAAYCIHHCMTSGVRRLGFCFFVWCKLCDVYGSTGFCFVVMCMHAGTFGGGYGPHTVGAPSGDGHARLGCC